MGACYGGTDVMGRPCAMARGKDISSMLYVCMCTVGVRAPRRAHLISYVFIKFVFRVDTYTGTYIMGMV